MNRIITLAMTEEFTNVTIDNKKEVCFAIGYLSSWAIDKERYKKLTVYGDKHGNLNAAYRNEQDEVTYTMFAERREDGSYSFNS